MIKPLYGNKPELGVRELMQNAIDAVLEFDKYLEARCAVAAHAVDSNAAVTVSVEQDGNNRWFVSVADRGIGMTEEVICNYFLRVGASFRRANAWRSEFEDESHHSRVLRSGRFGIGVLAGFLLGDKLTVSTRHISAANAKGLKFEDSIDAEIFKSTTLIAKLEQLSASRLQKRFPITC